MKIIKTVLVLLVVGLVVLTSCGFSESVQPTPTSFNKNRIVQIDAKSVSNPVDTPIYTPKTALVVLGVSSETTADTVYLTPNEKTYHRAGCRYLWKFQTPVERVEAITRGYTPCQFCRP